MPDNRGNHSKQMAEELEVELRKAYEYYTSKTECHINDQIKIIDIEDVIKKMENLGINVNSVDIINNNIRDIQKKQKKKKKVDCNNILSFDKFKTAFVNNSIVNVEHQVQHKVAIVPKATSKKAKKQQKQDEDEDIERILAAIEATGHKKESKTSKKKKNKDEDLENAVDVTIEKKPEIRTNNKNHIDNNSNAINQPEDEVNIMKEDVLSKSAKLKLKKKEKKLKQQKNENSERVDGENHEEAKPSGGKKVVLSAVAKAAQERLLKLKQLEEQMLREEMEAKRREEELLKKQEEERIQQEEEKERKRQLKLERKEKLRREGKLLSAKDKAQQQKNQTYLEQLKAQGFMPTLVPDDERKKSKAEDKKKKKKIVEESNVGYEVPNEVTNDNIVGMSKAVDDVIEVKDDIPDDWEDAFDEMEKDEAKLIEEKKNATGSKLRSHDKTKGVVAKQQPASNSYRSPVCCILGHVDTGKTKLLDKIRHSNVQDNESGGITQQIGATFFPCDTLYEQVKKVDDNFTMSIPGLLIIDTPGHESFNNLRARGSSLCDIAILVIDIMHGLEPQTRESLSLLRSRKCPFIIALNKIDRLYMWKPSPWNPFRSSFSGQPTSTQEEFHNRLKSILLQLQEEGLNCDLYYQIEDVRRTVSISPTSAITGEGIPDLLLLLASLSQNVMSKTITYKGKLQCTILEVKEVDGLGTTIDVILVNGTLHEGDMLVVCGLNGPIVTPIRALLTPQPLKELRVKGEYVHHKEINASMGVKISAQSLDDALAGTSVLVAEEGVDIEELKDEVMQDMTDIFKSVDRSGTGVYVMASTLGSLEALLQYLKVSKIPVFAVNIGTVHKMDVKRASVMREKGHPELSCILAFDVKVDADAQKEAKTLGVNIMTADIIYHLFDQFTKYLEDAKEEKKKEKAGEAIFPCSLTIIPHYVFNKKDPIVMGVKVEDGVLKVGTPLAVPEKDCLIIGRVTSLEHNKKPVEKATKGMEICIKVLGDPSITYGRHFDYSNKIYSRVSRDSIDCLKEHFRDEMTKDDWRLVLQLKRIYSIL